MISRNAMIELTCSRPQFREGDSRVVKADSVAFTYGKHVPTVRSLLSRQRTCVTVKWFTRVIRYRVIPTVHTRDQTQGLPARASLQIQSLLQTIVASRPLVLLRCKMRGKKKRRENRGKEGRAETSWGRGKRRKNPVETGRGGRGDLRKGVKERGCALTNRMAKETRRFYRRSDRIYEYDQH